MGSEASGADTLGIRVSLDSGQNRVYFKTRRRAPVADKLGRPRFGMIHSLMAFKSLHGRDARTAHLSRSLLNDWHRGNLLLCVPILIYSVGYLLFSSQIFAMFALGVIALLIFPGYILNGITGLWEYQESILGSSVISGLILQVGNIFLLYNIDTFVKFNRLNFPLIIILMTALETLIMIISSSNVRTLSAERVLPYFTRLRVNAPSSLFLVSLGAAMLFQTLNKTAILPDGALYLDVARSISNNGVFSSLILNDAGPYPFQNQVGLTLHIGTSLIYSLFFAMGEVSYQVAKWGASLMGALIVYPVFEIAKCSFGRRAAIIAAAIVATLPLFKFYTAIFYGPELLSTLLALVALVSIERALSSDNLRYSIISGICLFFAGFVWLSDVVPLVGAFALIVAFHSYGQDRSPGKFMFQFLASLLPFGLILLALAVSSNIPAWAGTILLLVGLLVSYEYLGIHNLRHIVWVVSIFLMLTQLYLLRFYVFPNAVAYPGAIVNQPGQQYFTFNPYTVLGRFTDYIWPIWSTTAFPVVLITALASILWVTRRALAPFSFFSAWILTRLTLLPGRVGLVVISNERFYLSITAILITFSAGFFTRAASLASKNVRISIGRRLARLFKLLSTSQAHAVLLAAFVLAPVIATSLPVYSNYLKTFNTNSIEANGWVPILNWVQNNTSPRDVLLTTGSPRLWAWFTDRQVVGTRIVSNGALLAEDQIGPIEFSTLISQFSPNYIIFDSSFQAELMFLPKLGYLYGNYAPGSTFSLASANGTIILETVISSISSVNNGTVTLYRVLPRT